ncbi:MAG: hypothetical protein WD823_04690 [Sulfuricaulis sp.]
MQIESSRLDGFLLVARQPREAIGEGIGDTKLSHVLAGGSYGIKERVLFTEPCEKLWRMKSISKFSEGVKRQRTAKALRVFEDKRHSGSDTLEVVEKFLSR